MSTTSTTLTSDSMSQDPNYVPRGPVEVDITFGEAPLDGSRPYQYVEEPKDEPLYNYVRNTQRVPLTDIRGHEAQFSLDKDAFEAITNVDPPSKAEPSIFFKGDDDLVKKIYYPEVEQLILSHVPGARRVLIFDHTIRRNNPNAPRAPVTLAHVDQTPTSAAARVRKHFSADDAERVFASGERYRIINVWRSLNEGEVQEMPLAFAAAGSFVAENDLMPVELRYPDWSGETAMVRHNEEQKWYYWSGMRESERLLLKCSDSREDIGRQVPHTAFVDPRSPEGARKRESIEVRCLVLG